jgi:hypothetical protein
MAVDVLFASDSHVSKLHSEVLASIVYHEFYLSYVRPLLTTEAIRLNILYLSKPFRPWPWCIMSPEVKPNQIDPLTTLTPTNPRYFYTQHLVLSP